MNGFANDDNWMLQSLAMPDGNYIFVGFSDKETDNSSTNWRFPTILKYSPNNGGRIVWEKAPQFTTYASSMPVKYDTGIGGFNDCILLNENDPINKQKILAIGYYADATTNGRTPLLGVFDYLTGNVIKFEKLDMPVAFDDVDLNKIVAVKNPNSLNSTPNIYICGRVRNRNPSKCQQCSDFFKPMVCKIDPNTCKLDKQWANGSGFSFSSALFGSPKLADAAISLRDIIQRRDGGFVISGAFINESTKIGNTTVKIGDAYLAGISNLGVFEWEKTFTEGDLINNVKYTDGTNNAVPMCSSVPTTECNNEFAFSVKESSIDNEFLVSCRLDFVDVPFSLIAPSCPPFTVQTSDGYLDCDLSVVKFKVDPLNKSVSFLNAQWIDRNAGLDFWNPMLSLKDKNEYVISGAKVVNQNTSSAKVICALYKIRDNSNTNNYSLEWSKEFNGITTLFCPFGLALTEDDGYVVCGNNEKNGDDYEFIKLNNNCQNNYLNYTQSSDINISTTTLWNSSKKIKGIVTVKTGNTLTIKDCTIEFANSYLTNDFSTLASGQGQPTKIIVEKGAALLLDHCILKGLAACNNEEKMWEGIEVLGDPNLSANIQNQGVLKMFNDAQITNSYFGICAGSRYYNQEGRSNPTGGSGGAIVHCSNPVDSKVPHFLNNRFSVWFAPYYLNYLNYSASDFKNTNFICNAPMLDLNYVTPNGERMGSSFMLGAETRKNIKVSNCTFKGYNNSNWSNFEPILACQGNAVNAFNSNFNFNACSFKDFNYGVYAVYAASFNRPTIMANSDFSRVGHGINLLGGAFHYVKNTHFTDMLDGENGFPSYGIRLEGADGSTIYDGTSFKAYSDNVNAIGIVETFTGANASLIKDCNFEEIQRGVQTEIENSGLQIRCNTYLNNKTAWSINPQSNGTLSDQGDCGLFNEQAGNIFKDNNCPVNSHINSSVAFEYRHRNIPEEIPSCNAGNVQINPCSQENSSTCKPLPDCSNPPCLQAMQLAINQTNNNWEKEKLQNLLLSQVVSNPNDEISFLQLLSNMAYSEDFAYMKISALIDENRWEEAEQILYNLPGTTNYDAEMIKIFAIVLNLSKAKMSVLQINEEQEEILQDIAISSTTRAKYQAQALLEVKNNMNFYRPIEEWQKKNGNKAIPKNNSHFENVDGFSVAPNPSNLKIIIYLGKEFDNENTSNIEIFDIGGKICFSNIVLPNTSTTEIDVSHFVSGVYMIRLQNAKAQSIKKILIVH